MGQEVGGRFKREGPCVCLWLTHADVWQRPAQYCKAIILQLKNKLNIKTINKTYQPITHTHTQKIPGRAGQGKHKDAFFLIRFLVPALFFPPSLQHLSLLAQLLKHIKSSDQWLRGKKERKDAMAVGQEDEEDFFFF